MLKTSINEFAPLFQSLGKAFDRMTDAFTSLTNATLRLSDAFTPEIRLAIQAYERKLFLSHIAARETFVTWGIPLALSRWLADHLPASVVLRF